MSFGVVGHECVWEQRLSPEGNKKEGSLFGLVVESHRRGCTLGKLVNCVVQAMGAALLVGCHWMAAENGMGDGASSVVPEG